MVRSTPTKENHMPVLLTPSIALAALLSPPARRTITPGWWSIDEQASFSDARAAHQLYGLDAAPERDRHKYFCDVCNRGFDRQKQLDEHLVGRPHAAALIEGDQAVSAWRRSAWFDANVTDDVWLHAGCWTHSCMACPSAHAPEADRVFKRCKAASKVGCSRQR